MMWNYSSWSRQGRDIWIVWVVLAWCVGLTVQQRNPITNFCRRWGHQTAVVDEKLFIDGGLMTFTPSSGTPQNQTNTYLIYHDLTTVSDTGMPPPHANLSKNSSIPSVNGGVLWPDTVNKRIYLFGGEFYDETPWQFTLYSYDVINDNWDDFGAPNSPDITPLSYGAGLSLSDRGEAFYYGGWMNKATVPEWGDNPGVPTSYILSYSMDTNQWSNDTGPDDVGRAEGVMVYIPAGDEGLLIYLGGIRASKNNSWEAQPMDEIIIFDTLSGKSYTQTATGDVPPTRRRFCAGASWPEDQSSYNIYVYGGLGEKVGSAGYDDVYILSIPTFTWVRMYPTDNKTQQYPHHSTSCNVVNNAQMLIHGGFFPLTNDCDASKQWGMHNLDLGENNKDNSPWYVYVPDVKDKYVVPPDIVSVVGGKSAGGATKKKPKDGFDYPDVQALMTRKAQVQKRTPTRGIPGATSKPDSKSHDSGPKLSAGAIAGIAVGGAAVLVAILVACFFLLRRRRTKDENKSTAARPMAQQLHGYNGSSYISGGSNHFSQGPWSPQGGSFATSSPPPVFRSRPETITQQTAPVELSAGETDHSTTPLEPKLDDRGQVWIPQTSLVHPALERSPGNDHSNGNLPHGGTNSPTVSPKEDSPLFSYHRRPTPQELATEAERQDEQARHSPTHETYYHP